MSDWARVHRNCGPSSPCCSVRSGDRADPAVLPIGPIERTGKDSTRHLARDPRFAA